MSDQPQEPVTNAPQPHDNHQAWGPNMRISNDEQANAFATVRKALHDAEERNKRLVELLWESQDDVIEGMDRAIDFGYQPRIGWYRNLLARIDAALDESQP